MIKYKLTTQDGTTHNYYQWSLPKGEKPGDWHRTSGKGDLCGPGWLHYYHHPLLAVLLNPIHADIQDPILWEVEVGEEQKDDAGLKGGATKVRLLKKIDLPMLSTEQRVAFGIYCALEICKDEKFVRWANGWLMGSDRSAAAAAQVPRAAYSATEAEAAQAAWAAEAEAAQAPWAVGVAARTAARAAGAAARTARIDLIALAQKAQQFTP